MTDMSTQVKTSVVIVNYCTADMTESCVTSLRKWQVARDDQIIVVDNASPDGSLARLRASLPEIKVIDAQCNSGFSCGINIGTKEATGQYLLVLNPDTYFIDDSINLAFEVLDKNPEIGLVGLDLIYTNGMRQYSARRFYSVLDILARRLPIGRIWPFKKRLDMHMMITAWKDNEPFEADWVMGTGFIIRRDLFQRIGCMDESYFLYMEDVDLCARVWRAGSKVVCVPNARLVHQHQRSSASSPFSRAGRMHFKSLLTFMRKYRLPLFVSPRADTIWRQPETVQ